MKTVLITITIFVSVWFLQIVQPEQNNNSAMADTTYANPNGSSELSLLMREMQEYTVKAKEALKNNSAPAAYPTAFDDIYKAAISEGMTKSDFYDQFSDLYITAVKNYSKSNPKERVETYNNMVNACLACHSQHCPGPVPVIKKMVWDPE